MPNLKRGFTGTIQIAGRSVSVTWDGSMLALLGVTDEKAAIGLLAVIERGTEPADAQPAAKAADPTPVQSAPPVQRPAVAPQVASQAAAADTPEDDGSEARAAAGEAQPANAEAVKKAKAADRATKARDKRAADKAAKVAAAAAPAEATETETETETEAATETETPTEPDGDPLGITETNVAVGPETVEVDAATAKKAGMNGAAAGVPDALKGQRTIRKVLIYLRDSEGLTTLPQYIKRCEEIKATVAILSRVVNMADKVERAMGMLD